jgi:hypothetical protein
MNQLNHVRTANRSSAESNALGLVSVRLQCVKNHILPQQTNLFTAEKLSLPVNVKPVM